MVSRVRLPDGSPAPLAQLVEQLTLNQWVRGSSPRRCTKATPKGVVFLCIRDSHPRVRPPTRRPPFVNKLTFPPKVGESTPKVHQERIKRTLMKSQSSFYSLQASRENSIGSFGLFFTRDFLVHKIIIYVQYNLKLSE